MDKSVFDDPLYDLELLKRRRLLYKAEIWKNWLTALMYQQKYWKRPFLNITKVLKVERNLILDRKSLTHNYGKPTPIEKAPFYAFESTVAMLATYAGIAVNGNGPGGESLR